MFPALRGREVFTVKDIRSLDLSVQGADASIIASKISELQLLKTCDHPNVLKYFTTYTNDRIPDHVILVTQP